MGIISGTHSLWCGTGTPLTHNEETGAVSRRLTRGALEQAHVGWKKVHVNAPFTNQYLSDGSCG